MGAKKMKKNKPTSAGQAANLTEFQKQWGALTFVGASAEQGAIDYFKDPESIRTDVVLGKNSKHPFKITMPILVAAMSTGALSINAKVAIAIGASMAGIPHNTGEGGVHKDERAAATMLIVQRSTGLFGWPKRKDYKSDVEFDKANSDFLKGCIAIEFKFGQGAKPGQGGLLQGKKITPMIAGLRDIPQGENCHSPAGHHNIKTWQDLKGELDWLKKVSDGLPIIVKFGGGHIEADVEFAVKAGANIIAIDGSQGGTGASPTVMLNEVGVDTMSSLVRARKCLNKLKKRGYVIPELIIGGGIYGGAGVAKAIALGADAVFKGFPFMYAIGCAGCKQCYKGECHLGIATQDDKLMAKLDVAKASEGVKKFLDACQKDMRMLAGATGNDHVSKLSKKNLRCISTPRGETVNRTTGVKMSYDSE